MARVLHFEIHARTLSVPAVPRMPVPGVGYLACRTDPEGNIVGVLQLDGAAA